jgi:hypothetical protein
MKWMEFKPEKNDKINEQAIRILSNPDIVCTVLFAVKDNKDGTKTPVFLISQNFRDPKFFIDDFIKLLAEHAKINQKNVGED